MARWDGRTAPAELVALVKAAEGLRLEPYDDGYGYWTIGYGARRCPKGEEVTRRTPKITEAQAMAMFKRDMDMAMGAVRGALVLPVHTHQAAALISLAFNLGDLRTKAATLVRLVTAEDWVAAANQFKEYRNSSGKPSLGLRRRRWAEAAMFLGADPVEAHRIAWSKVNTVNDWPALPGIQPGMKSASLGHQAKDPPTVSEADALNDRMLAQLRRTESHG